MGINYDKNPKVLNDFLDYLLRIKNYSENTVKAYCGDLMIFFDFLKKYHGLRVEVKEFGLFVLLNVKEADVLAFLVYLNGYRDNTASTRQRRLVCVRCFYRWLFRMFPTLERRSPAENIDGVERVFRLPKYLSLEECKRISKVFTSDNCLFPVRNNLMISLFLNAGLRVSELSGLNVGDVFWEDRLIRIVGKGNKERRIPIAEGIAFALMEYLGERILCLDGPLFLGRDGERLGVEGVERVCKRAFELLGLGTGYSAHCLRHTAATILYRYGGADVLVLKEFLGHESIVTTQVYTHVDDVRIRNAFDSNPLNCVA